MFRLCFFCLIFILSSCFEAPEFSKIPQITFKNIYFKDAKIGQDSLVLEFEFMDGDGDIGLGTDELTPPYHTYNLVVDADFQFVSYKDPSVKFPLYMIDPYNYENQGVYASEKISLPSFKCDNYKTFETTVSDGQTTKVVDIDTLLIKNNAFRNNIFIKIYKIKKNKKTDLTHTFSQDECENTFDSRIPIFDNGNIGIPIKGSIIYPMLSSGFKSVFLLDSIVIEFQIVDRALNKSNVVQTPPFTLQSFLKKN